MTCICIRQRPALEFEAATHCNTLQHTATLSLGLVEYAALCSICSRAPYTFLRILNTAALCAISTLTHYISEDCVCGRTLFEQSMSNTNMSKETCIHQKRPINETYRLVFENGEHIECSILLLTPLSIYQHPTLLRHHKGMLESHTLQHTATHCNTNVLYCF